MTKPQKGDIVEVRPSPLIHSTLWLKKFRIKDAYFFGKKEKWLCYNKSDGLRGFDLAEIRVIERKSEKYNHPYTNLFK